VPPRQVTICRPLDDVEPILSLYSLLVAHR
jgi:hypothetical protein